MPFLRLLPFPLAALAVVALLPDVFPPKDFVEYWSAARVLASGGDPYSGADLLPVQREATGDPNLATAVSLWTPPWTLPLYLPLGWLPFGVARWAWLFAQLLMVFAAADWLWRTYAGPPRLWFLPHLAAVLFAPTFWMVHYGQNTGFLLLGLAGFLRFRDTRPTLAGVFAALTAVKPHLLAVVGVLLLLDSFRDRGWRVVLTGAFVLGVGAAVAVLVQPRIVEWFVHGTLHPSPEATPLHKWRLPLIAFQIRESLDPKALDPKGFWVQFVPCAVACGLMAVHRLMNGWRWSWAEQMPAAVCVSCLFAPYGGWMFDLVVLLVPTVQLLSRARGLVGWSLVAAAVLVNAVAVQPINLHDFGWYAPILCGLWAAGVMLQRPHPPSPSP